MMMWYSAHGWGWYGCVERGLGMVVLWGAVIAATVVALRYLTSQQSSAPAPRDTGFTRAESTFAEGFPRSEFDVGEWYRRLM
jgi:uncharacterized membrane protein